MHPVGRLNSAVLQSCGADQHAEPPPMRRHEQHRRTVPRFCCCVITALQVALAVGMPGAAEQSVGRWQESQPLVAAEPQLRMASCLSLAKSDSIVRCASLESKLRSLQISGPPGEWRR